MASLHDELEKNLQDSNARPKSLPLDFLKAITHNFSTESELGRGGYGVVYKGVLGSGKIIAVKNLFAIHLLDDKTFRNEVSYLMDIKHPNVVQFIGYCAESSWDMIMKSDGTFIWAEMPKRLLCFEHLCNGSLAKYIYDESSDLKWKMRYGIIKGICSGLNFLHEECRLVHLDLKPENILMDATMIPKIADFGLSRMFGKQSQIVTDSRVGSRGYMAPEYLDQGLISKKADIFSFGVIIIEIITGRRDYPYFQLDSPQTMVTSRQHYTEKVLGNWRNKFASTQKHKSLEKYTHQVKQCVTVALKCVDPSMERRPTAKEIIQVFNAADQMEAQEELSPVTQCIEELVLLNTNTSKDPTPLIKTSTTSKVVDEATSEGLSPMLTLESSTITQNYQGEAKAPNEILSLRDPNTKAAGQPSATTKPIQPPVQLRPAPTPKKNGPWGGTTSDKLHDFSPNLSARLQSVTVIYYFAVNGLRFNYIGQDGYEHASEFFGNSGFGANTKSEIIELGPTEFVTELSGTYQYEARSQNIAIRSLKLVTNLGNTHGPFGIASEATRFSFSVPPNNRIVGFFGGSTHYAVNSIGAYTLENPEGCIQEQPSATTPQTTTTIQPIQSSVQPPPAPTPRKNGPWGGTTSEKPHDFDPNMVVRLKSVTFIYHRAVNGLRFNYISQDGDENSSGLFGNNGFGVGTKRETIELGPTEFVTELSGTYQYEARSQNIAIYSLKLVTNLGNSHGPFGTASVGTPFSFSVPPNNRIVGFFGGSTGYGVNSIGAYTLENSA